MSLAGTVAVPQTFPQLARLSIVANSPKRRSPEGQAGRYLLLVEHEISPKLTITRTFFLDQVAAVFIPADPTKVDFEDGKWFVGDDLAAAARGKTSGTALGIAYVRENAATLMQVEVGMTAAESAEYYPPLPHDRTVDHYRFEPLGTSAATVCNTGQEPDDHCSSASSPLAIPGACPVVDRDPSRDVGCL
jgi:hypothetical protein